MDNIKDKLIEEHFFRPKWYSIFLNPYFINRRNIFKAIKDFSQVVSTNDEILDVGCGLKPYENYFKVKKYTGIDIEGGGHGDAYKKADVLYDGKHIPFPDNSFDAILCTEVLEHTEDPEKLLAECARVLRSNGKILISMPFMYPEHEKPYDFRRYTSFELQRQLEKSGFNAIEIKKTTGFWGTFGQLFVITTFEGIPFKASIPKTLLSIFILSPIQIICLFLDLICSHYGPTIDHIATAKK